MKRHPTRLRVPHVTAELKPLIDVAMAFDATPAGAALVKFRRALQAAVVADMALEAGPGSKDHGLWSICRAAETELIAEIKRLQKVEQEGIEA